MAMRVPTLASLILLFVAAMCLLFFWEREEGESEHAFFAGSGIAQALLHVSQLHDKGKDDRQPYAFLLPTASTFIKYGIRNVQGSRNLEFKKKFEKEFSVRLLYE